MKNKTRTQIHPNQEDKSGKPVYASTTRLNASTNKTKEDDVNMPQGAESDYKQELLTSKTQAKQSVEKKPEQ